MRSEPEANIVGVLVSLALTLIFFRLRGLHPFLYGVGEIMVGTAAIVLAHFPPDIILTGDEQSVLGADNCREPR